ncbi:MAG TPA: CapA family protein [Acidimicrobiia bacterium]|nr:CapA family protein [Acidimicrobiia bacterium]
MPFPFRVVGVLAGGLVLGLVAFACAGPAGDLNASRTTQTAQLSSAPSTAPVSVPPTTPRTTTTALPTTIAPATGWVTIHATGDVNLDPGYIPALASNGYEWAWSGLEGLFLDDDLTLVNLECSPSSLGAAEDKEFVFQCPDGLAEMRAAGVEIANLGNNHSQDYGKEALLDGIRNLESVGVVPVGAGRTAAVAAIPALFDVNGWRTAVVGFGGIRPHDGWIATADQAGMADGDTIESMVATVAAAASVADFVVVTIHWGVELDTTPRDEDVHRAEAMIAAGADVVFGHHPHRLQPLEVVGGRPVFWSLGNFVWPEMSPASATTAVARVLISPEGDVTGCLIPTLIESSGHPVLTDDPPCGVP